MFYKAGFITEDTGGKDRHIIIFARAYNNGRKGPSPKTADGRQGRKKHGKTGRCYETHKPQSSQSADSHQTLGKTLGKK